MGFSKTRIGDKANQQTEEFFCDEEADVQNLPKSAPRGSYAYIVRTGKVYMINGSGEWIEQGGA